jgi:hypothetical protein
MADRAPYTQTDPTLVAVLEELRRREPIFHVAEFGTTIADFEPLMSPDYWEVGASGRRYSREFILAHLRENPPVDAAKARSQAPKRMIPRFSKQRLPTRPGHGLAKS